MPDIDLTARCARIQRILDATIGTPEVPLDHTDAYTLLIAVLLSAQCTDVRVNQVTPLLFAQARTPTAMVRLTVEEIRAIMTEEQNKNRPKKLLKELFTQAVIETQYSLPQFVPND